MCVSLAKYTAMSLNNDVQLLCPYNMVKLRKSHVGRSCPYKVTDKSVLICGCLS